MLLSVNNSVNAIDTTTPAPTTTTAAGTTTPTTPINPNEKIEILFKSRWTGNDRLSARVHLFANGEELDIQTTNPSTGQQRDGIILDYQNAWEYRQANLPRYDQDGNEITYTATQEIINEDLFAFHGFRFKTVTTGSSEERSFIFNNISIINIKVGKSWNEYPNIVIPGTPSPAYPPVMLNVNTLDSEDSVSYDEEELNELIAESDALDANDLSYAAYTSGLDEVDTSLEEDAQATAAQQSSVAIPDSITVNLLADGVVVGTIQVTKEQDWESEFVGYPRFDANDGHEINYTIEEVPVNGYKTEYVHTRVIDMIINRSIIDIPVVKKWVGKAQSSVQVTLHRKYTTTYFDYATSRNVTDNHDEVVETVELNEANSWKHLFTGLQKYNNDGSEVAYTVKEVGETANVIELDGKKFNVEYTGNTIDGFTVTNKKPIDPPTPTPTPKTSDNSHVMSYALLTLLSAFFVVIVASKRIKYSN